MFSLNDKSNGALPALKAGKAGITRRPAIILLATLAVAIIGSGAWTARASTLAESNGQVQKPVGTAGSNSPDAICPAGGQCFADVTSGNPFYAFVNRIYQQDLVSGYPCGGAGEPCDGNNRPYYRPFDNVTRQQMAKFIDNARHLSQIDIEQASGDAPIIARNDAGTAIGAYSTSGQALVAQSSTQSAIYAQSGNATVISAYSTGGANSIGVFGSANIGVKGSGVLTGVLGVANASGGYGVYGMTSGDGTGVYGYTNTGTGVIGYSAHGTNGVAGSSISGTGVDAHSETGDGLFAASVDGEGAHVVGGSHDALHALSSGGNGVTADSTYGYGIYATSTNAYAGYFSGNVHVTGSCCSSAESTTQVDDPLDPANKVLNQSIVQSPNMMDMLDGNITTDAGGNATVQLPPYFQALNTDFRYQLTVIGQFAQAIVSTKIANNSFTIKTDKPNVEVSWQVTGVRHDPYATAHPIQPEQAKPAGEQGKKYLYPTEYGQPASLGVDYAKQQQAQQDPPKAP